MLGCCLGGGASGIVAIPVFYISVFKLPLGNGKDSKDLMRRLLRNGSRLGGRWVMTPVT